MAIGRYPPAVWKGDGQSGGGYEGRPYRVVLHTTETRGVPGYAGGKKAPHLTYLPITRQWVQHSLLVTAARALANPAGGVQTNRANALQIEVVCYSNKPVANTVGGLWVGNLPDTAYTDLQEFISWAAEVFGVKPVWPGRQAQSYTQANAAGFRMSSTEWNFFNGVCGHQHVPENQHWDPGALNWARLLPTQPPDEEETMRVKEFVQGLKQGVEADEAAQRRTRLQRMFDVGLVAPNTPDAYKYWRSLLEVPDDPAWLNFVNAAEVEAMIGAKTGTGGTPPMGVYQISLTGKATPL